MQIFFAMIFLLMVKYVISFQFHSDHPKDERVGGTNHKSLPYSAACLVVVLVHTAGTEGLISSVLFNGWLRPSTERREIRERWIHVIVSIP